jgi:hypothetical protein
MAFPEHPVLHVGDARFEVVRAIDAPGVTHVRYRVVPS